MDYVKVLLLVMFGALKPVLCQSEPTAVSDLSGFHLELLLLHLAELESRMEELLSENFLLHLANFESRMEARLSEKFLLHLAEMESRMEARLSEKFLLHLANFESRIEARLSARMKELERNVVDACTQKMDHMVQNQTRHLEYVINQPAVFREGGWTTIQHRFDGSVNFYRNWTEYKNGFGDVRGEFWLGLEKLHNQTNHGKHELLVVLEDFDGTVAHAHYNDFRIGDEEENYVLKKLGEYSGTALDSLRDHEHQPFSTYDKDNDSIPYRNCAVDHSGAWWFRSCMFSHLNGKYSKTPLVAYDTGVNWFFFRGSRYSLKSSKMMIRKSP